MDLAAVRSHAAKHSTGPRFADGADKEFVFAVRFEQRVIARGELEWLRCEDGTGAERGDQKKLNGKASHSD